MTEVVTYSQIGKQDINFGRGTFETVLADGRKVTLDKVDLAAILNDETLSSGFNALGWYNIKSNGALVDGVTDDEGAIEETLDEAEAAGGGTVYIPNGTCNYATSPNWARANVNIYMDRRAVLNHTGTGNAFILDGGASGSGILGNRYDNLTIQGNASSTNGLYARSLHHCTFIAPRVKGAATTGAGIRLDWCVANAWMSPIVSVNTGTLSPVPKYGMYLSRRGSGADHTTTQIVINPIFEGLTQASGAGIYVDFAAKNEFVGGTSESNTNGIIVTGDSTIGNNTFRSMFLENNSTSDITLDGALYQKFEEMTIGGAVSIINNAGYCRFVGGVMDDTTLAVGVDYIRFRDVIFAAGSTLTDNSETTMYSDCVGAGGTLIINRTPNLVLNTASLPAAAAAQDGKLIIEDAGGSCNIVAYKAGGRFRASLASF